MNFKGQAVNHNVVVKVKGIENITNSGIDLTSSEDKNQKFKLGTVVSVGLQCPKREDGANSVEVGDEILFDGNRSTLVTLETVEYTVLHFTDIVIVF